MIAIIAIVMIGIMMFVLMRNKAHPVIAFSILPILAGIVLVFTVDQLYKVKPILK